MDTLFGFSFSKLIKLAKKKRQRERKLNQTPRRIRLGLSENLSKEAKDLIVHEGRVALVKKLFGLKEVQVPEAEVPSKVGNLIIYDVNLTID